MSKAKSRGRQGAKAARASASGNQGRLWWFGGGLVLILGVVLVVVSAQQGREPEVEPTEVETYEVASAEHVNTPVSYDQTPPVGGPHAQPPLWQNCGYYSEPVRSENAVHSLEHGAVWFTYQSDLPEDQIDTLRGLTARSYVVVSPWDGDDLPAPVVASAWGKQKLFESADDPGIVEFRDYFAQGPQTPEPGATCSSGVGSPE